MFEIESDDVALLNEEDLRELVGRLCEAELEAQSLSVSSVTRGGHQNAADGGIDVRVSLPTGTSIHGFVPRAATGFQVKRTDMPANAIDEEMRPDGTLRPAIKLLAAQNGAYVIVSSLGSVADFALTNRLQAMREALVGVPGESALKLNFYDRTRLASWIRAYPAIIPWVRARIGKPIAGWQSFAAWCGGEDKLTDEYFQEKTLRLKISRHEDGEGFSPVDGISHIRDLLRSPGRIVRLVGLSGVGKTRLVQALFDERIGLNSLNKSLAAYVNLADGPDPLPIALVSGFAAVGKRAIVIVDNCPADLHHRLSEVCRAPNSTVSAITIEYDIREDEPEGTEVVSLEPASEELIERLIQRRRPDISQVDARTISEFSGGNARIAFALARTIELHGTVAGLKDAQLFLRLFQQRHDYDADLLMIAEACSLVYSFDVDNLAEGSELSVLASIIQKMPTEVFRNVAELLQRDLVQRRGRWRAVLPQAIANRLAASALKKIPLSIIKDKLVRDAPSRLAKSFSRRISYLHDSPEAVRFAEEWLAPDGLLDGVGRLDELKLSMFENAAPLVPVLALEAIERSQGDIGDHETRQNYVRLASIVRSVAFDAHLFDRSISILEKIAFGLVEDRERIVEKIASLFHIYLSGTHAPLTQRLAVVRRYLQSPDADRQALGIKTLAAMLEASNFYADHHFEFGGRSRDYGAWPKNEQELVQWYTGALELAGEFTSRTEAMAPKVRAVLAARFRGLWAIVGIHDALEALCLSIAREVHWSEGWAAVRQTKRFDRKEMSEEIVQRLSQLEVSLRPTDLAQRIRSIVIGSGSALDFEDDDGDIQRMMRRTEASAYCLGMQAAEQRALLREVLPDLLMSQGRVWSFGRGLAKARCQREELWSELATAFAAIPEGKRMTSVLGGFIFSLRRFDSSLCDRLLEAAITDDRLAKSYPILEAAAGLNSASLGRVFRSLGRGMSPIANFGAFATGRAAAALSVPEFCELLSKLCDIEGGNSVAIMILALHLHGSKAEPHAEIRHLGRSLLQRLGPTPLSPMHEHWAGDVAALCTRGDESTSAVEAILKNLRLSGAMSTRSVKYFDVVKAIIRTQAKK